MKVKDLIKILIDFSMDTEVLVGYWDKETDEFIKEKLWNYVAVDETTAEKKLILILE